MDNSHMDEYEITEKGTEAVVQESGLTQPEIYILRHMGKGETTTFEGLYTAARYYRGNTFSRMRYNSPEKAAKIAKGLVSKGYVRKIYPRRD
jgi:hypothetical protein